MQSYSTLASEKNYTPDIRHQDALKARSNALGLLQQSFSTQSDALNLLQQSYASTRTAQTSNAQAVQFLIGKSDTVGSSVLPLLAQHKLTVDNTSALTAQLSMDAIATSVTTCWSSRQMTRLMQWRNPPENAVASRVRTFVNIVKKTVTECCLPLLTLTSAIETVAYKALSVGAKLLSPLTKRAQEYVEKHKFSTLRQSAQFTCLWTIISLWGNIKEHELPTTEKEATSQFRGLLFP